MVEKRNGRMFIYDPQSNKKYYSDDEMSKFLMCATDMSMTNLSKSKIKEAFADLCMKGYKNEKAQ